jgi:RHS repeat-associated protein
MKQATAEKTLRDENDTLRARGASAISRCVSGFISRGKGMQFEYGFDDIGNRHATAAGGNASGTGLRPASYAANLLNQYTSRTVPGGFDVLGAASATNAVTVNASPADYRRGEFFQELLTANNTNATLWQSVKVTNTASGAYETGAVFLAQSPEALTYDADGNLLSDGRWDYTWDGENRLIQMETRSAAYTAGAPRQKLVFGYDWQGPRISKTLSNWVSGNWSLASTWSFLYDGWNLLAIVDAPSSILQSFLWGLDLSGSLQGAGGVGGLVKVYDATTDKHYFPTYDGNGNVMALVDAATGAEAARYEYGPFGEPIRQTGDMADANPFRFSTKFTDEETGMLYYGYRSYNPATGRWLSKDPLRNKEA